METMLRNQTVTLANGTILTDRKVRTFDGPDDIYAQIWAAIGTQYIESTTKKMMTVEKTGENTWKEYTK